MIHIDKINNAKIESEPYEWASINELFSSDNRQLLSQTYPLDHFKSVTGKDGEKSYVYDCRNLIGMGASSASFPASLHDAWKSLVQSLLSLEYKEALSQLCKKDLTQVPMEVNLFHYSPGTWMGPHVDLKDKIVTHVFYFNEFWKEEYGGCLSILSSKNPTDVVHRILPITGNSALLIRSNTSWHAVDPAKMATVESRRSMTVTFYHPGSVSTMWPPNDRPSIHTYGNNQSILDRITTTVRRFFSE